MNLTEFKKAHKAAGGHFFNKAAMDFFSSRIESRMIGGRVFITSERFESLPRGFKVRAIDPDNPLWIETLDVELPDTSKNWDGSFLRFAVARQYAQDYLDGYHYEVQGLYDGWEAVTASDTLPGAQQDLADYVKNDPSTVYRVRRVRTTN